MGDIPSTWLFWMKTKLVPREKGFRKLGSHPKESRFGRHPPERLFSRSGGPAGIEPGRVHWPFSGRAPATTERQAWWWAAAVFSETKRAWPDPQPATTTRSQKPPCSPKAGSAAWLRRPAIHASGPLTTVCPKRTKNVVVFERWVGGYEYINVGQEAPPDELRFVQRLVRHRRQVKTETAGRRDGERPSGRSQTGGHRQADHADHQHRRAAEEPRRPGLDQARRCHVDRQRNPSRGDSRQPKG